MSKPTYKMRVWWNTTAIRTREWLRHEDCFFTCHSCVRSSNDRLMELRGEDGKIHTLINMDEVALLKLERIDGNE